MARQTRLGLQAQKAISDAVESLFERATTRFLGRSAQKVYGKRLVFKLDPRFTLPGLFETASKQEGVDPREEVVRVLSRVAGAYLDAHKERTKARVLQSVQTFLADAQSKGVKTNLETVLGGQLTEVWADVKNDIKRIVETETTIARNTGIFDAIGRIGAMAGREDPTVFFVVVRDGHRCEECTRLHLMPDKTTPRVWKMSELGSGYHTKGQENPKVGGLHPNCRCVLTHLLPGYGFDGSGRVTYVTADHDELKKQRT